MQHEGTDMSEGVLAGTVVLDLSHQYSGALTACLLADLGAEVVAVEHPRGSPMRTMLPQKDGESLWWKVAGRGKRGVTLDLSRPAGADLLKRLVRGVDVVIENFRPGTLERWGIGPQDLAPHCDGVVMLRISGFGQTGPMRDRPGFGTVAEAMSGFAHLNGFPDQPPSFPATTLADGCAATFGAVGTLALLLNRSRTPWAGVKLVDVALFESLFRLIPVQIPSYDQLGVAPIRPGNFLGSHGVLRNLYRTADGVYFCVSAIGHEPIRRILDAAGADELAGRVGAAIAARATGGFEAFLEEADAYVTRWAAGQKWETVAAQMQATGAVFQRIYDAADIVADEQYRERGDLISVDDTVLGAMLMPGIVPKFPGFEHAVERAGPALGEHNGEFFGERLGLTAEELETLRRDGVI
jgi:crotonobetainyl-CoA:carnitine CoA-transferase CaiB-like acyl-CoA transferase